MTTPIPPSQIRIVDKKPTLTERVRDWFARSPRIRSATPVIMGMGVLLALQSVVLAYQILHTGQPHPDPAGLEQTLQHTLYVVPQSEGGYCTEVAADGFHIPVAGEKAFPLGSTEEAMLRSAPGLSADDSAQSVWAKITERLTGSTYFWGCSQ